MKDNISRKPLLAWSAALLAAALGVALFLAPATVTAQQPTIKLTPIVYTPPDDGHQMYVTYCAPCHGISGKGDGPAAPAFKYLPTNLTQLTRTHGGNYPDDLVRAAIQFGTKTPAHGSAQMPVWGAAFRSLDGLKPSSVSPLRIANLVNYVKTLQAK